MNEKMKSLGFLPNGMEHLDKASTQDIRGIKEKMTYAQIAKMKPKVCFTLVKQTEAQKNNNISSLSMTVPPLSLSHNKSTKTMKTITDVKEKMSSALSNIYRI